MRIVSMALTGCVLLALAGCGSGYTPKRTEIQVVPRSYSATFAHAPLTADDQAKLERFLAPLPLTADVRLMPRAATLRNMALAKQVRNTLLQRGFSADKVTIVSADENQADALAVQVSYVVALPPAHCPDWSDGYLPHFSNAVQANFGCADAANLAAQVADPGDLAQGHGGGALDADRNQVAITKYKTDQVQQTVKESASTSSSSQ